MKILIVIAIILLACAFIFCVKRIIYAILNLIELRHFNRTADPINQRHGIVFNKTTQKLEADQSPILPYE